MWKLTGLFSLIAFLSITFGALNESISLKVKVVGKILEEKPKLIPPDRITVSRDVRPLDLSGELLEAPKGIEEPRIEIPKGGGACGEPKDKVYYRAGLKYYTEGRLKKAEGKFLDVLSLQSSAFVPQSEYMLGLIYAKTNREKEALKFFESSCSAQHPFRQAACESLYALEFKLRGEPIEAQEPELWKVVYEIKNGGEVKAPACEGVVFKDYCTYVQDFAEGRINDEYKDSTELRKAIVLIQAGNFGEAKLLLKKHNRALDRHRDVALYYLGVIAFREGKEKEAYRYASLLEISNRRYAEHLYLMLSGRDVLFSKIAYEVTGAKEALLNSGVHSYNRGNYDLAYAELTKAGEHLFAAYAAIREGDYERAYSSLRKVKSKDREYYLWLLETLYWLGRDREMDGVLAEIREKYTELYREYKGWLAFKRENWKEAYKYFKDPYHRALALFNAGRYGEVIKVLRDKNDLRSRLLKAKAAISMGKGALAREFLTEETPEEIYLVGMSFFIEGEYAKAIGYFERLLSEDSLKSRALLRIADSHYNLGNYDRAKELYKEILTFYPDSPEALDATLALAQIELQKPTKDLERLVRDFEKKFPGSPMITDLKYQLANLYIKEGRKSEARRILQELLGNSTYRAKALIKLAELENDPVRKEELLKKAMREGSGEDKERATGMLMSLYLEKKEFEKLADFLSKGDFDDRKKALSIYISENIEKAIKLFNELYEENPNDEELKVKALELYDKTKGKKYLKIARESQNPKVRARALYLLGLIEKKKDKNKALEYFVEVVLSSEGIQPYYNRSILEAVDILLSLKAKKDASCLLARLDRRYLTKRDIKKVKILKKKLPKCEVKK
ncbi:tetratricopeptide repeat protein [Hydrogenivirga sp.]